MRVRRVKPTVARVWHAQGGGGSYPTVSMRVLFRRRSDPFTHSQARRDAYIRAYVLLFHDETTVLLNCTWNSTHPSPTLTSSLLLGATGVGDFDGRPHAFFCHVLRLCRPPPPHPSFRDFNSIVMELTIVEISWRVSPFKASTCCVDFARFRWWSSDVFMCSRERT